MQRLIIGTLVIAYGGACAYAAFNPQDGLLLFLAISLVTVPYFVWLVIKQILIAVLVSALMAGLIATIAFAWVAPVIGCISVIWAFFTMINKFIKFVEKLLYALGNLALYGFLALSYVVSPLVHGTLAYVFAGGMAVTGIGLMSLLLFIYYKIGRQTVFASVYIVGFQWYLVIFIIKLLIPGDDDNNPDDDYQDGTYHHHHHHA